FIDRKGQAKKGNRLENLVTVKPEAQKQGREIKGGLLVFHHPMEPKGQPAEKVKSHGAAGMAVPHRRPIPPHDGHDRQGQEGGPGPRPLAEGPVNQWVGRQTQEDKKEMERKVGSPEQEKPGRQAITQEQFGNLKRVDLEKGAPSLENPEAIFPRQSLVGIHPRGHGVHAVNPQEKSKDENKDK